MAREDWYGYPGYLWHPRGLCGVGRGLVLPFAPHPAAGTERFAGALEKRRDSPFDFAQIMALYNAAPEKWEMQVDSPTYYPHGKERDGLLVFMLPKERKRYRKWFDWRLSHGEDAAGSR